MQTTIKQLIREVSDIALNHKQIKSFDYGEPLTLIKKRTVKYTALWMNISVSSFDEKKTTFNIEFFCMDRVNKDDRNKVDVENTTSRILRDIYNIIRFSTRWQDFGELVQSVQNQKYYDYTADRVTGWGQTISFNVWNTDCFADLPMGDYDFNQTLPIDVCDVLAIVKNSDNDTLATKLVNDGDNVIEIPNITITDSDGTEIDYPSGVNFTCSPGGDANYELDNTLGTLLSSGSIPSGDTQTIIAPNATYTLQNTTPTTLGSGSIASGVNGVITVGTTKLEVLNTVPTLVLATNLPSGVPAQVTAPNGTVINNTTPTYSAAVPSGATVTLPQITVTDSDGSTFLQDSVTNVMCTPSADATVTVNGNAFATVPSGDTLEIEIQDGEGNPYLGVVLSSPIIYIPQVPINVNGVQIIEQLQGTYDLDILDQNNNPIGTIENPVTVRVPIYNTANLTKTGQQTSFAAGDDGDLERGRGVDFMTLDFNNPFGNTNRFTDELGDQTYTSKIIIDWSQWNQRTNTVTGYAASINSNQTSTRSWAQWMAGTPYTVGSFGSWVLANYLEMATVIRHSFSAQLNYAPFNINENVFCSTTRNATTSQAYSLPNTGVGMLNTTKVSVIRALLVRTFTISGTTLS